jgi:hypothetical protein
LVVSNNIAFFKCPPLADIIFPENKKEVITATPFTSAKIRMSIAMTNRMVIVTSFKTRYNSERKYHEVIYSEETHCPYCGGGLKYRNSRKRKVLDELRNVIAYLLRRLWCAGCLSLHTEIPDIIQPYRHFSSSVIQDVITGGDVCAADDSTIRRWRNDFDESKPDIEQRLKSVYARETGSHAPITTETKTLCGLMKLETKWLAYVMKLLINCGHRLCTRFAFCPEASTDKVADIGIPKGKGGRIYDKTEEDTG